jgi:hypothetical protein
MVDFDDKGNAEEAHFAYEQELRFKARSARNRRLADWAADLMDMNFRQRREYAEELVEMEISKQGDEAVFQRIHDDFKNRHVAKTDHQIRRTMEQMLAEELEKLGVKPF